MLQMTETAVLTAERVREQQGIPSEYGIRVFATETANEGTSIALGFVEAPRDGDVVTEQHGTLLFVAPDVAEPLSDAEIDVVPDASRNGSAPPQFVFQPQPGTGG
jgi:Fe-S cluster assembly iron-binding protein IscA